MKPSMIAAAGLLGVDGVLNKRTIFFRELYAKKSVKVPPTSTPISQVTREIPG
jgi:hypothetical protein